MTTILVSCKVQSQVSPYRSFIMQLFNSSMSSFMEHSCHNKQIVSVLTVFTVNFGQTANERRCKASQSSLRPKSSLPHRKPLTKKANGRLNNGATGKWKFHRVIRGRFPPSSDGVMCLKDNRWAAVADCERDVLKLRTPWETRRDHRRVFLECSSPISHIQKKGNPRSSWHTTHCDESNPPTFPQSTNWGFIIKKIDKSCKLDHFKGRLCIVSAFKFYCIFFKRPLLKIQRWTNRCTCRWFTALGWRCSKAQKPPSASERFIFSPFTKRLYK